MYHPEPYAEPIVGAAAIAGAWLEDPDEPWLWAAEYRPLLVAGDVGVAAGTSTYYADDGSVENVFHNLFVADLRGRRPVQRLRDGHGTALRRVAVEANA